MGGRRPIPLLCALAALATSGVGAAVSLHTDGWDARGLVRVWAALRLSKFVTAGQASFPLRHRAGHYDGAFFYAIARDPLATGQAHHLLPTPAYYWGHPAYGWLAWLASGGGRPDAVPDALLAVGLASVALAGAAASALAGALGWSPWGGLTVALNPGLVFAVYSDTSESLGAALLLGALAAYTLGRRRTAVVLLAALCFDKEPLVLVPLSIAAWGYWRDRRPWREAATVALAVVPACCWWLYLRVHLGAFPFGAGSARLTAPFLGWERGLELAAAWSWNVDPNVAQLGEASIALIIVVGGVILVASAFALRLRSAIAPAFLALAALYACITPNGVEYPKDLIREVALVVALLPYVFFTRPRVAAASGRRSPPAPPPASPPPGS